MAMHAAFGKELQGSNLSYGFPLTPPIFSVDGGAGAILSIGLLRRLDARRFESCVLGQEARTGGPETCGGFGYTDPGFELQHPGILLFDTYDRDWRRMHAELSAALVGGCDAACRLRLDHAVTVHTNAGILRGQGMAEAAAHVQHFLRTAAGFAEEQAPLRKLAAAFELTAL
ncbi:hypothetical protein ABPG75_009099 [Micractinium tetrahymenae]